MLRKSQHHLSSSIAQRSSLFSTTAMLRSSSSSGNSNSNNSSTNSGAGAGGGVNETAFPEDADWLGGSSSSSSLTPTSAVSSSSSSSSSSIAQQSSSSLSSEESAPRRSQVPIGIRQTNTESLMNQLEQKGSVQAFNKNYATEFSKLKSGDVTMRTQRALAAASRRNDHFLLADLDPDLDTVMFGTSTEEFEKNVKRMKTIVSTYQKWERWDKVYMYGTRIIQVGCVLVGFLLWEAANEKYLLQTAAEDYAAQHTELIKSISENRQQSMDYLIQDVKQNPPKIYPPNQEKYEEIMRLSQTDDIKRHPMDTRPDEEWEGEREMLILQRQAQRDAVASCGDHEFIKRARRIILPMADDWTSVVKEEMAEYQRKKMDELTFPRLDM